MDKIIVHAGESLQFREGLLKFKDLIEEKLDGLDSLYHHRDLIEFITKASESLHVIFLPPEEFRSIVQYLLQFQNLTNVSSETAVKLKQWSSIQLRYIARLPKLIVQKFPFMGKCNMANFLTQVILKVENEVTELLRNDTNMNLIEKITCQIGKTFIANVSHNQCIIASCIRILSEIQKVKSDSPFSEEFLSELLQLYQSDPSSLDSSTLEVLYGYHPVALEYEILSLLSRCCSEDQVMEASEVEALIKSSRMVKICAHNSSLFRNVLTLMTDIWFTSEGHPKISQILSAFIVNVEKHCTDRNVVTLFPCSLQHLAMLLSVPPVHYCLIRSSTDIWKRILSVLQDEVCSKKEVIIMLVIYSKWYSQLLQDVMHKTSEEAEELIELLWSCEDEESIKKYIEESLNF